MLVAKQPLYQPQLPPARRVAPRVKSRPRSAPLAKQDKLMIVLAILLVGIASLGLVWRFTRINDLDYRISQLERQNGALQQANAGLIVELKKLSSPSQLERRAQLELGMQWPSEKQIINVATSTVATR